MDVTEVVTLTKREWSRYRCGQFKDGREWSCYRCYFSGDRRVMLQMWSV